MSTDHAAWTGYHVNLEHRPDPEMARRTEAAAYAARVDERVSEPARGWTSGRRGH
jgi:hypothetical protein